VNKAGGIVGAFSGGAGKVDAGSSLQPYDDVFSLARFRENEVIHGRWAMLAALGVLVAEGATGVSWADATAVELEKASYLGLSLPFSATALAYINPILIGGAELYRNAETDPEKRCYPGGVFDPLGLASSGDADATFRLKEAELKHGRLAMLACLGFGVQQLAQGEGALGSLKKFADSF
jgi:light-harvesting complex II chlorophyll a/b binding protein 4